MSNDYEFVVKVTKTYKTSGFGDVDDLKKFARDFDSNCEFTPSQIVCTEKELVSYRLFEDEDYEFWNAVHRGNDKS